MLRLSQRQEEEEKTEPPPMDNHTFVALIDIVFTLGKKRTCTGTIIHDNVVITAAHCFVDDVHYTEPDLTASFVVIGTKKMYDTGYENYLPIERILSHPKYKGWTADIALVYTFAGMTVDKPGNIIPIVGESTLTPVDSNVTILSWGRCNEDILTYTKGNDDEVKRTCDSSEENHDSCERAEVTYRPLRTGGISRDINVITGGLRLALDRSPNVTPLNQEERDIKLNRRLSTPTGAKGKKKRRRLTSLQPHFSQNHRYKQASRSPHYNDDRKIIILDQSRRKEQPIVKGSKPPLNKGDKGENVTEQIKNKENQLQKYFKNWRRTLGPKENKLSSEIFGFVNVQSCKKLVEKTMPQIYMLNTNEVVCYAADDHYLSEADSGAPAVRQGHLVAVTVGGVECEGDHVAIGIKMNCFCSWIAENLPDDENKMNCCADCCGNDKKEDKMIYNRQRYINISSEEDESY